MDKTILLHAILPEDLQTLIREAVREEIKTFREGFVHREGDQNALLNRAEACKLLKISLGTLYNWTKSGNITAYSMGNRIFYKKIELLESLIRLRYR